MSKPNKKRPSPAAPRPENMPTLCAFWEELKRHCGTEAPCSGHGGSRGGTRHGSRSGSRSGSRGGSQSGGSQSGGEEDALGYGLGLIAPDRSAEERVRMILRMLVEKDAKRDQSRKNETRG
ncbi:MAG: hypothetical protein IKN81_08830 [Oscillospiraceae bacterium]|nr:hypothetical protein [Oscillospiraceae bacterium]